MGSKKGELIKALRSWSVEMTEVLGGINVGGGGGARRGDSAGGVTKGEDVGDGEAGVGKLSGSGWRAKSSPSNRMINAGYRVCTTIGRGPKIDVDIIVILLFYKKNPHTGVIVRMSNSGSKFNCSLSVSILCNLNGVQGPQALERLGACDYVTEMKHPSGCAIIVNVRGGGLGWFGTFMIIVLCLFAAYLLAGIVYRFFFLGIRGVDIIPNLDFWVSLPRRTQSLCASLVRRFKGPAEGYRSSYSSVNF
ncbi:unnamed protein product [Sphenostylis stenocarpa]|uniref:Autophagy-related protein 27 n=1 Tax=Sphenostylis stenocarpa TaxID=92480 RepID=A0AA86RW02_9FABA|nr:unnamed protein product [Sphenostylis stenocarpa]